MRPTQPVSHMIAAADAPRRTGRLLVGPGQGLTVIKPVVGASPDRSSQVDVTWRGEVGRPSRRRWMRRTPPGTSVFDVDYSKPDMLSNDRHLGPRAPIYHPGVSVTSTQPARLGGPPRPDVQWSSVNPGGSRCVDLGPTSSSVSCIGSLSPTRATPPAVARRFTTWPHPPPTAHMRRYWNHAENLFNQNLNASLSGDTSAYAFVRATRNWVAGTHPVAERVSQAVCGCVNPGGMRSCSAMVIPEECQVALRHRTSPCHWPTS